MMPPSVDFLGCPCICRVSPPLMRYMYVFYWPDKGETNVTRGTVRLPCTLVRRQSLTPESYQEPFREIPELVQNGRYLCGIVVERGEHPMNCE